ncbi:hypothetical protein [Flavobacterium sp.]|uniref:hypothetical protein n=1 Tax=Flavobacterium sp. TaxID=239 RepID=UPI0026096484|nr:hypothetical protein [Flavobacterium sp.]MDD3004521.1 hypothetical protein [Flavobacterium sp.]
MNSFLKYKKIKIVESKRRKIPLPIFFSVNCQTPAMIINAAIKSLIFLWYISVVLINPAKVIKSFKNIFIKLLAIKKNLCIFALGFKEDEE